MTIRLFSIAAAALAPLLAVPAAAHAYFCNDPTDWTAASLFSTAWANSTNPTLAMTSTIQFADVDGDGRADLCGHDGTQVVCYTHHNAPDCEGNICTYTPSPCFGFGTERLEADFGSDFMSSASRYKTLRFPDINGDGRADVCARKSDGLYCALSYEGTATTEDYFGTVSNWSSMFSDGNGWNQAKYYTTIGFVKLDNAAGLDVCARGSGGIVCGFSGAGGFSSPLLRTDGDFGDGSGWGGSESYYGTVRFADIDDDTYADVCGRGSAGVYCARWNAVTRMFGDATLWTSLWSDVTGGSAASAYKTLQLADVNGDGAFDVCGRKSDGVHCGLSNSVSSFATDTTVDASSFSDANGWNTDLHYRTIRVVDADGDGRADVCGRGGAAIHCQLARTVQTPTTLFHAVTTWVNNFGDNAGWGTDEKYWGTVQPADLVDTWAGVEFCGRGSDGIWCSHR